MRRLRPGWGKVREGVGIKLGRPRGGVKRGRNEWEGDRREVWWGKKGLEGEGSWCN